MSPALSLGSPARVFVVMPFRLPHSPALRQAIQAVCSAVELEGRIADEPVDPIAPLRADIISHLHQAEVVIVDITRLNANVAYELGVARALGKEILLLCRDDQEIPVTFRGFQHVGFGNLDSPPARKTLRAELQAHLQGVQARLEPEVLINVRDRTIRIIEDLRDLAALPSVLLRRQTVWSSGFLSSFALGPPDGFEPAETGEREALLAERAALIDLAERGCRIACIISPGSYEPLQGAPPPIVLPRMRTLLEFIRSGAPALDRIDWAVSPYWQKNFLIVGNRCCYERFQKSSARGEALTLRQATQAAVRANTAIYELLLDRLANQTLQGHPPSDLGERRRLLAQATASSLEESIAAIEGRRGARDGRTALPS